MFVRLPPSVACMCTNRLLLLYPLILLMMPFILPPELSPSPFEKVLGADAVATARVATHPSDVRSVAIGAPSSPSDVRSVALGNALISRDMPRVSSASGGETVSFTVDAQHSALYILSAVAPASRSAFRASSPPNGSSTRHDVRSVAPRTIVTSRGVCSDTPAISRVRAVGECC